MTVQHGFIGFDGVPFIVLATGTRDTVYPDWEQDHDEVVFRVYDSNISVVQDMGVGLATWTVQLQLDSLDTYRALRAKQRTVGVLTIYAGYTVARGVQYHDMGTDWEDLDEVELVTLSRHTIPVGHAYVETTATFRRAMNPFTGERV